MRMKTREGRKLLLKFLVIWMVELADQSVYIRWSIPSSSVCVCVFGMGGEETGVKESVRERHS